jgi:HSP20 family protein
MPDTTTMPETAQQDQQTTPGTDRPEHHQTQAAAGTPQAGGAPMANATAGMTSGSTTASPATGSRPATGMSRRGSLSPASLLADPLGVMRSMMDQMDRLFDDFLGGGTSRYRQPAASSGLQSAPAGSSGSFWYPQVEVSQRGGNLVVCADLPGLRKEDVHLEVHDDYLVLQGERRQEQEENQGGVYRSERSYGRFFRTIPLPQGTNAEQARANFKDGVLEITVPMPNVEPRQGRTIEIQ